MLVLGQARVNAEPALKGNLIDLTENVNGAVCYAYFSFN